MFQVDQQQYHNCGENQPHWNQKLHNFSMTFSGKLENKLVLQYLL